MLNLVNSTMTAMLYDGTLKGFSEKWFGLDLTVKQGG
jgi:ABC-type amino acid transport substrate-binding protein